jgi:acyl carrier protein
VNEKFSTRSKDGIPFDGLEAQVAVIMAAVLKVGRVGRHDNFYDLGGGSLAAMRICARIESQLGLEVDPVCLIEHDSLASFVAQIRPGEA